MRDTPAYAIGNAHAEHVAPGLIALQGTVLNRGAWPESLEPGKGGIEPVYNLLSGGFEPCKQIVDDALAPGGCCFHQIIPLVGYPLENGVEFINDPLLARLDGVGYGREDGVPHGRGRIFQIVPLGGDPRNYRVPQIDEEGRDGRPDGVP